MDNPIGQQQDLIYSEGILQILSDVLDKYKLKETADEIFKKLETNEKSHRAIVMSIVRNLVFGNIQEGELPSLLSKELTIDSKTAEDLAVDIKKNIFPLVKKGTIIPEETEIEKPQIGDITPPSIKKSPLVGAEEIVKNIAVSEPTATEESKKAPKKVIRPMMAEKIKEEAPQPSRPRGQDSYREPIE